MCMCMCAWAWTFVNVVTTCVCVLWAQALLLELRTLIADKGTFGGLDAFVADGFSEGLTY